MNIVHRLCQALVLLVFAVAMVEPAIAMDRPPDNICAVGFSEAGSTRSELTCVHTEHVASAEKAEETMEKLQRRKGCSGEVTEEKASVADGIAGDWLVTMLFSCATDE